jgi:hypothetical protein
LFVRDPSVARSQAIAADLPAVANLVVVAALSARQVWAGSFGTGTAGSSSRTLVPTSSDDEGNIPGRLMDDATAARTAITRKNPNATWEIGVQERRSLYRSVARGSGPGCGLFDIRMSGLGDAGLRVRTQLPFPSSNDSKYRCGTFIRDLSGIGA